jgi:hypothetical protein
MTRSATPSGLIRVGIGFGMLTALTGGSARAVDGPLLVVVEAPPALDADAAEIRRAIGTELHSRTVAPMKTPTEPSDRALIVALDRDRITMSLRTSDAPPVARSIPVPSDHAARLRAIAWLAGNLARDQVGPIVAESIGEPSTSTSITALPVPSTATEPPPGPAASALTAALPPVLPPPSDPGGETLSIRAEPRSAPGPLLWSISGSIGPIIADVERVRGTWWSSFGLQPSTVWQLSVQRRRAQERLVIGGRLEGTYNNSGNGNGPQLFGADVFVGSDWRFRYCNLEATLGAGPEATNVYLLAYATPTMEGPYQISVYRFGLYAQGSITAAMPLTGGLEGLLQIGVHLTSSYAENWFMASSIGVRYRLP